MALLVDMLNDDLLLHVLNQLCNDRGLARCNAVSKQIQALSRNDALWRSGMERMENILYYYHMGGQTALLDKRTVADNTAQADWLDPRYKPW